MESTAVAEEIQILEAERGGNKMETEILNRQNIYMSQLKKVLNELVLMRYEVMKEILEHYKLKQELTEITCAFENMGIEFENDQ